MHTNNSMSPLLVKLVGIVHKCIPLVTTIQSKGGVTTKSATTREEYLKLASVLLERARYCENGLAEAVQNTARPPIFYKRIAALRYYCFKKMEMLSSQLPLATDDVACTELISYFSDLLMQMQTVSAIQHQGMIQPRKKRNSKRQALSKLPPDWRTALCMRGARGKYATALLVSALTGVRPHELTYGVEVWKEYDEASHRIVVCFAIHGAKVKANQGQPYRLITYAVNDSNPLVAAMAQHLDNHVEPKLIVQITNPGNFTVEIRRLGRILWPMHKHSITAYCFRHQWSADIKSAGNADAVSRGLGHISAKTRRFYGTAQQTSATDQLRPLRIEAERSIKKFRSEPNLQQHLSSSHAT